MLIQQTGLGDGGVMSFGEYTTKKLAEMRIAEAQMQAQAHLVTNQNLFSGASGVIVPIAGTEKKERGMFSEAAGDLKKFIKEHKSLIYWVLVLLIVDHFFFKGAFKEKLTSMMHKLVGKVESKLDDAKV